MELHAVILAGGRGERFWPLSRRDRPKQVLALMGEQSLLEQTVSRLDGHVSREHTWIIAGADQRQVLGQLGLDVAPARHLWEPLARNTGPAIAASAEWVLASAVTSQSEEADDPVLLVLPSDHWIPDTKRFWESVDRGCALLNDPERKDTLITFGIPPTHPETGYGYIERGEALEEAGTFAVRRFHEKPDRERALRYLQEGGVYWNAGIFLFRARALAKAMRQCLPDIAEPLDRLSQALGDGPLDAEDARWRAFFEAAPAISIDHGVMETADQVAVVEASFEWTDLGGWLAWAEYQERDDRDNRYHGQVLTLDAHDNVVYSESPGVVALLGVHDLIVVRVGDVTLVCPKDRAQEVRRVARAMAEDPETHPHA